MFIRENLVLFICSEVLNFFTVIFFKYISIPSIIILSFKLAGKLAGTNIVKSEKK
jgi:hypothetical protein